MRKINLFTALATAAFLLTMLPGCSTLNDGSPKLAVAIPNSCERILTPVPEPPLVEGGNGRGSLAQYRAALVRSNVIIIDGRRCIAGIRKFYATGK